jgi:hypothetical protein
MRISTFWGLGLSLALAGCATGPRAAPGNADRAPGSAGGPVDVMSFPELIEPQLFDGDLAAALKRKKALTPAQRAEYGQRIAHYLGFLGIDPERARLGKRIADSQAAARTQAKAAGKKWEAPKLTVAQAAELAEFKMFKATLNELWSSSLQFILCDDLEDWACLEHKPWITPNAVYRQDARDGLGAPVPAGESFNPEVYFSQRYFKLKGESELPERRLVFELAKRIQAPPVRRVRMALYGIDDIQGSMKPVFDAIAAKRAAGGDVEGVFDSSAESAPNSFLRTYDVVQKAGHWSVVPRTEPLYFSYVAPPAAERADWIFGRPDWMDQLASGEIQEVAGEGKELKDALWFTNVAPTASEAAAAAQAKAKREANRASAAAAADEDGEDRDDDDGEDGDFTESPGRQYNVKRMAFQYDGTESVLQLLNDGIQSDEQARGRLEWPPATIMHNKFFVFEDAQGRKSVWSGTTNVARTCMGEELNANMAISFRNDVVAQSFVDEFDEMFRFDPAAKATAKNRFRLAGGKLGALQGRFHGFKRPNTHRYFTFKDGTEVRVHFSPTDDGAHRAVLPVLLSARAGDTIRVAMYGAGGTEFVRAFQYAQAKGADIRIVLDTLTAGGQVTSWVKHPYANLNQPNPYVIPGVKPGKLEVVIEQWPGLNHHKTATLTRADGRAEVLIVGSQNWSSSGNNKNDENMISIRHRGGEVPAAAAFNRHFDERLWPAARQSRAEKAARDAAKGK